MESAIVLTVDEVYVELVNLCDKMSAWIDTLEEVNVALAFRLRYRMCGMGMPYTRTYIDFLEKIPNCSFKLIPREKVLPFNEIITGLRTLREKSTLAIIEEARQLVIQRDAHKYRKMSHGAFSYSNDVCVYCTIEQATYKSATCSHYVFCEPCLARYLYKYPWFTECPLCRETMPAVNTHSLKFGPFTIQ